MFSGESAKGRRAKVQNFTKSMSIEFYGEISLPTKKQTERLKRMYFARWIYVLAAILAAVALVVAFTRSGWQFVVPLIFAALLGGAGLLFVRLPYGKKIQAPWKVRVVIDGEDIVWTQYLPQKEVVKKKKVQDVKKVFRTASCYYLVYNDVSNAIVCERCLLRRGTFDAFEMCFEGKVVKKQIPN